MFPKPCYIAIGRKIRSQDPSLSRPNYFMYCLFKCANNFCSTHLNCGTFGGVTSHCYCTDKFSDSDINDRFFRSCPRLLRWLHDPVTSRHLIWKNVVTDWIILNPPPNVLAMDSMLSESWSYSFILHTFICYSSFFLPVSLLVHGFLIVQNLFHPCMGMLELPECMTGFSI